MQNNDKIVRMIFLIILNVIVLVLVFVFSNFVYARFGPELHQQTLYELKNNTLGQYPYLNVGKAPFAIGINEHTNTVYVANSGDGTVSVIDGETNENTGNDIKVGNNPLAIG